MKKHRFKKVIKNFESKVDIKDRRAFLSTLYEGIPQEPVTDIYTDQQPRDELTNPIKNSIRDSPTVDESETAENEEGLMSTQPQPTNTFSFDVTELKTPTNAEATEERSISLFHPKTGPQPQDISALSPEALKGHTIDYKVVADILTDGTIGSGWLLETAINEGTNWGLLTGFHEKLKQREQQFHKLFKSKLTKHKKTLDQAGPLNTGLYYATDELIQIAYYYFGDLYSSYQRIPPENLTPEMYDAIMTFDDLPRLSEKD